MQDYNHTLGQGTCPNCKTNQPFILPCDTSQTYIAP